MSTCCDGEKHLPLNISLPNLLTVLNPVSIQAYPSSPAFCYIFVHDKPRLSSSSKWWESQMLFACWGETDLCKTFWFYLDLSWHNHADEHGACSVYVLWHSWGIKGQGSKGGTHPFLALAKIDQMLGKHLSPGLLIKLVAI